MHRVLSSFVCRRDSCRGLGVLFVAVLSLFAMACDNKSAGPDPDETTPPTPDVVKKQAPDAFSRAWALTSKAPEPDKQLLEVVNKLTEKCTWAVEGRNVVPECKTMKFERIDGLMAKQGPAALSTILHFMSSDTPQARKAATWMMNNYLTDDAFAANPYTPTADELARLKELIKQSLPMVGRPLMRTFVHLNAINQKYEDVMSFASSIADDAIRAEAYRHGMTYGRMGVFPAIKKAANDAPDVVRRAALQAPLRMKAWTPGEQKALCPWARTLLTSGDRRFRAWPPKLLRQCPNAYMTPLVNALTDAVKQRDYGDGILLSYDYLCGPASQTAMTAKHCGQLRDAFMEVLREETTKESARIQAMTALIHQWPDAQTFSIAGKVLRRSPSSALGQKTKMLLRASKDPNAEKALKQLRAKRTKSR